MQKELETLRSQFAARGWPAIHIGVGVNSGEMSVGNMGSSYRMAYTALGDAVNLGARLEGITKEYGVGILVGENSRNSVDGICFRELDLVRVKGKNRPVAIYEPLGLDEEISPETLQLVGLFNEFIPEYRNMNWNKASRILDELKRLSPDEKLYTIYAERIEYFKHDPPPAEWDGVFVFKTK